MPLRPGLPGTRWPPRCTPQCHMWQCIHEFTRPMVSQGVEYDVQVWGLEREDRRWEGRLVFVPEDGGPVLCTSRETTQSNGEGLRYWATGLEPVYLEGAFGRAAPVV